MRKTYGVGSVRAPLGGVLCANGYPMSRDSFRILRSVCLGNARTPLAWEFARMPELLRLYLEAAQPIIHLALEPTYGAGTE